MKDNSKVRSAASLSNLDKLAWYLDSSIRIPGTKWTIGLDGLLGLIPGVGDLAAGAISSYILMQAVQKGVSGLVIARMLINIAVDTVVGAVPVVGDIFDFAFKANLRNVNLIHSYEQDPKKIKRRSGLGVAAVILAILALFSLIIWLVFMLLSNLLSLTA
ncbi:MAG: DUF4112 domain-containing protein [Immundisolibacteraceae bacterium]|nr:DUF4112 domain-containing protein [Immundisolibacteraceae bacterium]